MVKVKSRKVDASKWPMCFFYGTRHSDSQKHPVVMILSNFCMVFLVVNWFGNLNTVYCNLIQVTTPKIQAVGKKKKVKTPVVTVTPPVKKFKTNVEAGKRESTKALNDRGNKTETKQQRLQSTCEYVECMTKVS